MIKGTFILSTLVAGGEVSRQAILTNFCMKASIVLPLISLLSKMEKKYFPPFILVYLISFTIIFHNIDMWGVLMYKYMAKDTYFQQYFALKVIFPFQFPYFPLLPPLINKEVSKGVPEHSVYYFPSTWALSD